MKKRKNIPTKQKIRGPATREEWDTLLSFIDKNDFTVQDFLACVCANLLRYTSTHYKTRIVVGNSLFDITITKEGVV